MTYRQIFKRFLKKEGVYSRYMELAEKHLDTYRTLDEMFDQEPVYHWISAPFVFSITKEGYDYWWDIHSKWNEVIQNYEE